jgi:hypothetical protein
MVPLIVQCMKEQMTQAKARLEDKYVQASNTYLCGTEPRLDQAYTNTHGHPSKQGTSLHSSNSSSHTHVSLNPAVCKPLAACCQSI